MFTIDITAGNYYYNLFSYFIIQGKTEIVGGLHTFPKMQSLEDLIHLISETKQYLKVLRFI